MDYKKTGNLISMLRKEKNMTQRELAEQLHVSDRTISKWERGAGLPDASLMIALSDLLGITVNELLTGERRAPGSTDTKQEVREAASVIYQHVHAREKQLRYRLLAAVLVAVVLTVGVHLFVKRVSEDRILFPPKVTCEILQKEVDLECELQVDRRNSGVYDYGCAYGMDRYGNIQLKERSLWQSYTDAVPAGVYEVLQKRCSGTITNIDRTEGGFLVISHKDPETVEIVETNRALDIKFMYELDTSHYTVACRTAFLADELLCIVSYNSSEDRVYLTTIDKTTREERVSSFSYQDIQPDARTETSAGGFLFSGDHLWVKDDILYFAETYYQGPAATVFGAYDLKAEKQVSFELLENAQVVLVRKEPSWGQVLVLVNPMGYQPLRLYTLDDTTLEMLDITELELPNEYLTRQGSSYERSQYYLWSGDVQGNKVAVLFDDVVSRANLEDHTGSCILVVYDRESGKSVWRGRFLLDKKYEICDIALLSVD